MLAWVLNTPQVLLDDSQTFFKCFISLKENVRIFKKLFTSYAVIFCQRTFFSIIKAGFPGKREFYLFSYNAFFQRSHII